MGVDAPTGSGIGYVNLCPEHSMDTADIFRPLARELVAQTIGASKDDIIERVAGALKDAFESGVASSLIGIVAAVEAVRVPPNGMVVFKVPAAMPESSVEPFRRDLTSIARLLEKRLGFQPIILTVPDEVRTEVFDFDMGEGELPVPKGEVVSFPGRTASEPTVRRGIVAFNPLKLRDRILDMLDDDITGTVTVQATESAVVDGRATHHVRVVLPAEQWVFDDNDDIAADIIDDIADGARAYATATNAVLKVVVCIMGGFVTDDSPRFEVRPD